MNELALFAGAGGGILGGHLLGWKCVCAVEIEDYPRRVLLARQRDGILPEFPIWDDIKTFDGNPWRKRVDVVSGGFPCQDISAAGSGEGIGGSRSGLWSEMARVIGEVQPRVVFVENSPMLTLRGLDRVLGDLATLGYDARWGVVSAENAGAAHIRERIWIVAHANGFRQIPLFDIYREKPDWEKKIWGRNWFKSEMGQEIFGGGRDWREVCESGLLRGPDDVAYRVDRTRAVGNGQVPAVAKLAWEILGGR
ncbi:DNA cytosine methyltransferase [bacterium]|nr:DNA cytosine methyltransferase [bacterium]